MLEKGTVKVVWVTKNTKSIYSKMFSDLDTAKNFAEKKRNCLVFRLVWHRKLNEFSWALLPYGEHKLYQNALKFYYRYRNKRKMIENLFRL